MNSFKKLMILTVTLGMTLPMATAQLNLGVRGGINMASMSTNVAGSENSSIMGIQGGLTTNLQLMKKVSFGADVLFSQFGNNATTVLNESDLKTTKEETTTISYALVPLYLNFEIPITPKQLVPYRMKESFASFHLYGGGYFGYALGATTGSTLTEVSSDPAIGTTVTVTPDAELLTTDYNAIDFGIMAGAGFSFRLDEAKKQRLYVDCRYFLGMSDFNKDAALSAKNTPLGISIAYSYKLTDRIYTNRKRF